MVSLLGKRFAHRNFHLLGDSADGGKTVLAKLPENCDLTSRMVASEFHDTKQHLDFEDPQSWSREAVRRTAPLGLLYYGLVIYWYVTSGHKQKTNEEYPWYKKKKHESFADMLIALKQQSFCNRISAFGLSGQGSGKTKSLVKTLRKLTS